MTNKNTYAFYIVLIMLLISCSSKKVSYEQKIEAPLADNQIGFDLYAYKQDTSITITTPKGTVINIDPNTFVHKNGATVTQQISLKIREMHTVSDIFKSGIPMSLSSDRENFLQSGGMFEIRAFDNNEELVIDTGKSIGVALANFKPSNGYSLYHLTNNQNWQVSDTFIVQKNERKARALNKIANFLKTPFTRNTKLTNYEFELVADSIESPHLSTFNNQKWKIMDETDPEIVDKWMRISWDDVIVKPINIKKKLYSLTFTRTLSVIGAEDEIKILKVKASPANKSDTAFAKQLLDYEQTIAKMKEEKIRLQAEADMLSSFRIRQMGIWNIDKIMNKDEFVNVSVKFDFERDVDPMINHIKLFVLFEDDNSVISYLPQDWKNVRLSKVKRNSLVAVLPGNKVAIVDAKEVMKKLENQTSLINFATTIDNSSSVFNPK